MLVALRAMALPKQCYGCHVFINCILKTLFFFKPDVLKPLYQQDQRFFFFVAPQKKKRIQDFLSRRSSYSFNLPPLYTTSLTKFTYVWQLHEKEKCYTFLFKNSLSKTTHAPLPQVPYEVHHRATFALTPSTTRKVQSSLPSQERERRQ